MSKYCVSAFARSNVGKKRTNNEDNFSLSGVTVCSANDITASFKSASELATAVFDGMGGEAAGEVASQLTANVYCQRNAELIEFEFSQEKVTSVVNEANNFVCTEITKIGKRMGCTFVSLGFCDDNIHIANVGDSRAYLLRSGKLYTLSKDHTVAQSMVDSGMVSYEDSQKLKEKHKLTQHIGIFPEEMIIEPYFKSFKAQEDDVVLLCSDGLTDMLSDGEIAQTLNNNSTNETRVNALVEAALQNGGKDNVTVIVATVKMANVVTTPPISNASSATVVAPTIAAKTANESQIKVNSKVTTTTETESETVNESNKKKKKSLVIIIAALVVLLSAIVAVIVLFSTENAVSTAIKEAFAKESTELSDDKDDEDEDNDDDDKRDDDKDKDDKDDEGKGDKEDKTERTTELSVVEPIVIIPGTSQQSIVQDDNVTGDSEHQGGSSQSKPTQSQQNHGQPNPGFFR